MKISLNLPVSTWAPSKNNIVGIVATLVVFPMVFHYLYKDELEIRDRKIAKLEPGQRTYL